VRKINHPRLPRFRINISLADSSPVPR
jgi:hypothetical protein